MHLDTALACAVIGLVTGWFVPQLIARIPEPQPAEPVPAERAPAESAPTQAAPARPAKILYAEVAAAPGLAWKSALASALCAGLIGAEVGWEWSLTFLLYLCPVGVALAYVDYRTRLLPTRVIAPSYAVVAALALLSGLLSSDTDALVRAAAGWLVAGLAFWLLWRFTPGMGYGDVRLSGVLGIALGFLGWPELLVGIYSGFLIGTVGWIPLRLLRITKDRNFPFGPFMLVGAVVGVVWGADVAGYLAA
jgi:leader peptidase (prepilin peptidase) / N-methyltransferase